MVTVVLTLVTGCSAGSPTPGPNGTDPQPVIAHLVGEPVIPTCTSSGTTEIPDSYRPVDVRTSSTGDEVTVAGVVIVTGSCRALAGAKIEFWYAADDGTYPETENRGWFRSDGEGRFELRLARPGAYEDAPPHVHLLVNADGYTYRVFTVETRTERVEVVVVLESPTAL